MVFLFLLRAPCNRLRLLNETRFLVVNLVVKIVERIRIVE